MSELTPKQSYTRTEVLRMLGITERELIGWEKHGLIEASEVFGFSDLLTLRTLLNLKKSRVPSAKIRTVLVALRSKLQHVKDPLKELKVFLDGKKVRVELGGQQMEPVSGQLLLNFDQTELRRLLSFPGRNESDERARRQQADSWFQKGLELERAGGPVEEAISAYETAAKLDPTSAGALVNLGTIYFNARTWSKSEHYYRTAIEVDPNYALAHFNLANLYDERGDYAQAMVHYETAVKLNPRYSDAHYNLALLYQGNGQVMEAVRHWKSYLKLDPGSAWSAIARRELDKLRKTTVLQGKLVR